MGRSSSRPVSLYPLNQVGVLMARYKVPDRSFINNSLVEAGSIVEYNGDAPGSEWELVEEGSKKEKTSSQKRESGKK